MRQKFKKEVERARVLEGEYASQHGDRFGAFFLVHPRTDARLKVLASDGTDEIPWDHVSVSCKIRCPTWEEMAWVKDCFWDKEECVVQYHPARSTYVNQHEFCLHMWRPTNFEMPMPPVECV